MYERQYAGTCVDDSYKIPRMRLSSEAHLGNFGGNTILETFLARFKNCSEYFCWDEEDKLFHLRASLSGVAGQILRKNTECIKSEDIISLLRTRFGNGNQTERFRAELRTRKRTPGESLQRLYQDMCRLANLAYPGPPSELAEIVSRDALLDALNNHNLRVRVRKKEPKNLEEDLSITCRLEAFDHTNPDRRSEKEVSDVNHRKGRFVCKIGAIEPIQSQDI